ncbi:hypothetical protein [Aurantiacibacter sediminis]|uniref:DUF4336 domain-containing protein n=1 Tax=Aurantiacibacter sediminis TaxID=2793064 RepID=A0ABS0N0S5_9SPHN|nr:hypothetical protein [Aurantiacibacter sediminis]MBH5321327.1 hypothetical protein [Aurantiacibacter sediminis]
MAALGTITKLVAPNSYHYLHIDDWALAHASAAVFAPRTAAKNVKAQCEVIKNDPDVLSRVGLPSKLIDLGNFQEVVFFHEPSRTLIVTDLMQNFEASRASRRLTRFLLKAGGATGPSGQPSLEIRHAARKHKSALGEGIQQMLDWHPEQIILSHGKCYRSDAVRELERAFAWH